MPSFSNTSTSRLLTCHPDIQEVLFEAIKYFDMTVLEGVRSLETQKQYVASGSSRTLNSKHLRQSDGYSHAVDVAPYPIDWEDKERFAVMADIILGIAKRKGIDLEWGGSWRTFYDGPHFQKRS